MRSVIYQAALIQAKRDRAKRFKKEAEKPIRYHEKGTEINSNILTERSKHDKRTNL